MPLTSGLRRSAALLVGALAGAVPAGAVLADAVDDEARAAFERGKALEAAGQAEKACEEYARALGSASAPGPLRKVAACDARNGRFREGARKLRLAAREMPPENPERAGVEAQAAELEAKLAKITIQVLPERGAAKSLTVDGEAVPASASEVVVDPGEHAVVAVGAKTVRQAVRLAAGEARVVALDLAEAPKNEAGPRLLTILGWTSVGVAGAGAIALGVTSGIYLSDRSDLEACIATAADCSDQRDSLVTLGNANVATWVITGAFGALGAGLLIADAVVGSASVETTAGLGSLAVTWRFQ